MPLKQRACAVDRCGLARWPCQLTGKHTDKLEMRPSSPPPPHTVATGSRWTVTISRALHRAEQQTRRTPLLPDTKKKFHYMYPGVLSACVCCCRHPSAKTTPVHPCWARRQRAQTVRPAAARTSCTLSRSTHTHTNTLCY